MIRGGPPERRQLATEAEGDTGVSDSSSGSGYVNTAKNYARQIKSGTTDLTTTNPREWTGNQYLGVATGIASLWMTILLIYIGKKCRDKRRNNKRQKEDETYMNMSLNENKDALLTHRGTKRNPSSYKYQMVRPRVVRATGSGSDGPGKATAYGGGGFDATDPNKLPLGARLHGADKLRAAGMTGSGVRVAIIDSGIDHTHPGFHDKVRTKRWFRNGTPLEEDDHGTHVAGTIHFLAPDADLFDYRVFGKDGDFDGDIAIAKSIRSAVDVDKCHLINMSLRCSYPVRPEIEKAIKYASKMGVHLICAAGNDGDGDPTTDETFTYPARFDETISVAAVRKEQGFPPTSFSESNSQVTYSGIGRDVVSLKPFGGFQTMSGTSMATPHVSGLIACLLSGTNTNSTTQKYTDRQLRNVLRDKYLVDIGPKGYDKQTGEGFVTYLADGGSNELFDLLSFVQ